MQHLSLDGKLGIPIGVDLCSACRVIWFDHLKDLQLAPAGTLNVFGLIASPNAAPAKPLPDTMRCPRCGVRLALTHDMQRTTRFQYWRCEAEHGHLMTFVDFLREKDFVRPLSPSEIDQLRQSVQTVNCGNCGAPIDLAKDSICGHCGAPLSILDPAQMARTVTQLQAAASTRPAGAAVEQGARAPDLDALVRLIGSEADRDAPRPELIDVGLQVLRDLLKRN